MKFIWNCRLLFLHLIIENLKNIIMKNLIGKRAVVNLDHKNYQRQDYLLWDNQEVEIASNPIQNGGIFNVSVYGRVNGITSLMLHELTIID